ncbi:MAG TPA: hypothetical protein VG796_27570 [Verrucomicrobiales bacterium]|nr:hypothetical protein [Verrucomicrobiales bacterium]
MKYPCVSLLSLALAPAVMAITLGSPGPAGAQEKKPSKAKNSGTGKAAAKAPAAQSKYDQHLSANLKLLKVLSRYAETLSSATDATAAGMAVNQIETITKDAIIAGEELVKLGKPAPDVAIKLAQNPDLEVASRRVAEQTRTAVKALAGNDEAKNVLTPAIENFQSALNRIQQDATDPKGPGAHVRNKNAPGMSAGKPSASPSPAAPAAPNAATQEQTPPSKTAAVPPPPPQ